MPQTRYKTQKKPKSINKALCNDSMVNMALNLPLAAVARIAKSAGAERIGNEATIEMTDAIEAYGKKLAEKANSLAQHAGRKTIQADDIKLARESL